MPNFTQYIPLAPFPCYLFPPCRPASSAACPLADTPQPLRASLILIFNMRGERQTPEGDNIVFSGGYKANTDLVQVLAGLPCQVYKVGDCVEPVGIMEAIRDGCQVGRMIE